MVRWALLCGGFDVHVRTIWTVQMGSAGTFTVLRVQERGRDARARGAEKSGRWESTWFAAEENRGRAPDLSFWCDAVDQLWRKVGEVPAGAALRAEER